MMRPEPDGLRAAGYARYLNLTTEAFPLLGTVFRHGLWQTQGFMWSLAVTFNETGTGRAGWHELGKSRGIPLKAMILIDKIKPMF